MKKRIQNGELLRICYSNLGFGSFLITDKIMSLEYLKTLLTHVEQNLLQVNMFDGNSYLK